MGALALVQAQAKTFSPSSPLGRWLQAEINRTPGTDADVPAVAGISNAVHTLNTDAVDTTGGDFTLTITIRDGVTFTTAAMAHSVISGASEDAAHQLGTDTVDHTGGSFTLTITLLNGETFTTAAIAYNANAATVEIAIDTAATGQITSWTDGDITVAGVALQTGTMSLVFDGTSVDAEPSHVLTVFNDSMTGGTSPAVRVTDLGVGVESQINIAASAASVAGWSNGDIQLVGPTLQAGALTMTFSGTSVDELNHPTTIFNDSRTGGTPATPLVTVTAPGQAVRAALSLLLNYGIITGAVAAQDAPNADGAGYTKGNPGSSRMSASIVKAVLAEVAAEDENNSTYHAIEEALYGAEQDRANAVESRLATDE